MLKFCKKILSIGFCIILIVVICNLIVKKYYSNPHYLNSIITMQVGDDLQNYQFMNKLASKAYLTSIIKLNNKNDEYEISFRQYYNHDSYDFKYIISENECLDVYFCVRPFKKQKKCKLLIYEINKKTLKVKLQ